jgi:hypothetical protein
VGSEEVFKVICTLDKGDRCVLKASQRRFLIIDERRDESGNFEELCKFDDDERHPIWILHSSLSGAEVEKI